MFALFHPSGIPYHPTGSAGQMPVRGKYLWLVTWVHVLLFVPQFTGFLYWADHTMHVLPFPPILYLSGFGMLHLILTTKSAPTFTLLHLAIFGLLIWRLLDVSLQRYGSPELAASFVNRLGLTLGFCLFATTAVGTSARFGHRPLILTAIISICVSTSANLAEMMGYLKNSSVTGRAAGFIPDANDSAIAIICMLALLLTLNQKFWINITLTAVSFIGIFPTLSRSGFLVFVLVIASYMALNFRAHAKKILLSLAGFVLLGIGAVTVMSLSAAARNDSNVQDRVGAIFGGDTKKMESSERMKDLQDGLEGALENPVLGHGTGAGTIKWKPHNQFVSLWVDLGIFGVGLYVTILLALLYKAVSAPAAALLCVLPVIAFLPFSQTLVDTSCYWMIALLAALRSSRNPFTVRFLRPASPTLSSAHAA